MISFIGMDKRGRKVLELKEHIVSKAYNDIFDPSFSHIFAVYPALEYLSLHYTIIVLVVVTKMLC